MIAETPALEPAVQAVREYADAHASALSSKHTETLFEAARRLERLGVQAAELIEVNSGLWLKEQFDISFDPGSDTLVISVGDFQQQLKLRRADPDVPIRVRGLTAGGAYHAGTAKSSDEEQEALRNELRGETGELLSECASSTQATSYRSGSAEGEV
jgi:hypothetical protein